MDSLEQEFEKTVQAKEITQNLALHLLADYVLEHLIDTCQETVLVDVVKLIERTKGTKLLFKFRDNGNILEVGIHQEEDNDGEDRDGEDAL